MPTTPHRTLHVLFRQPSHAPSAASTAARASAACMAGTRASVTRVAGSVVANDGVRVILRYLDMK